MSATTYETQPVVAGDTVEFVLLARKNGTTWDLTGGSVSLYLRNPAGTVLGPYAATLSSPTSGEARYRVGEDVLTEGDWKRQWKVSVAGVVLRSRPIEFQVVEELAA